MPADFETYLRALAGTPIDQKTEHTDRAALERLLQAACDDAELGAHVQHEPRRDKGGAGSPDFKVTRQGRIAGYVEVKPIDENLSKVLKSEQIKKYKTLSDNIILTDYLEFCWIGGDGTPVRHRLAHSEDLSARGLHLKPEAVDAVRMLLRGFFSATPQRITRSLDLALALASRAAMLHEFLTIELNRQAKEHEQGRLGLATYQGRGDHAVEAVRYSPEEQKIWINKTQGFEPVPRAVWDFQIGGYQVLGKYLKSRKGRKLSLDEINHVSMVANSLAFTLDQIVKIDVAYRMAFEVGVS